MILDVVHADHRMKHHSRAEAIQRNFGIGLGPAAGVCAIALLAAEFAFLRWLCIRQIGGQTGDVLGALEQIGEITIMFVAAARAGG